MSGETACRREHANRDYRRHPRCRTRLAIRSAALKHLRRIRGTLPRRCSRLVVDEFAAGTRLAASDGLPQPPSASTFLSTMRPGHSRAATREAVRSPERKGLRRARGVHSNEGIGGPRPICRRQREARQAAINKRTDTARERAADAVISHEESFPVNAAMLDSRDGGRLSTQELSYPQFLGRSLGEVAGGALAQSAMGL